MADLDQNALEAGKTELAEAARAVIESKLAGFKARNGRWVTLQDDSGEKMWIVPFDEMYALEYALSALSPVVAAPEPTMWFVLAENGNCRFWTQDRAQAERIIPTLEGGTPLVLYSAGHIASFAAERDEWKDAVLKQNSNVARNLARAETAEARIAELEAALREARMQALASDGQAQEAHGRAKTAEASFSKLTTPRPISDWSEEDGSVLLWHYPIQEPPQEGSPLDIDFNEDWHQWWTPLPNGNEMHCAIKRALSKSEPVKG